MGLYLYRITYKDGRIQEVEASSTRTTKEFIYFDDDGDWLLQVAADSVESVSGADVPRPVRPGAEHGDVHD
jgi:hypothetical protein